MVSDGDVFADGRGAVFEIGFGAIVEVQIAHGVAVIGIDVEGTVEVGDGTAEDLRVLGVQFGAKSRVGQRAGCLGSHGEFGAGGSQGGRHAHPAEDAEGKWGGVLDFLRAGSEQGLGRCPGLSTGMRSRGWRR